MSAHQPFERRSGVSAGGIRSCYAVGRSVVPRVMSRYAASMAWPETLIAALAAFGSGAAGVAVSLRQTKATLLNESTLQRDRLKAEIDLSREVREHQLLRDAYAPMMSYVEWAKRVNAVRANVLDRTTTAFGEVRPTNVLDAKAEDVVATRAAIDNNSPTELEQKMINGSPTTVELFRILGLVDVVASGDVLNKFHVVIDSTAKIEEAQIRYEKALLDLPSPLGSEPSFDEVAAAARQQISSYTDALNASLRNLSSQLRQFDIKLSV